MTHPAILETIDALGETTLIADPAKIVDLCRYLKDSEKYIRLSSVTAVDWHPTSPRFEVVYHLHSLEPFRRLRVKCRIEGGEKPEMESICSVWRAANWYEREVWDMFGIHFNNHPDLQRILMPTDWEGHPLRKDYPVHGYKYSYSNE
ncbi:MAG: NADH-quinone oxidoreductase subunit C [Acidobacteriota bacterium]